MRPIFFALAAIALLLLVFATSIAGRWWMTVERNKPNTVLPEADGRPHPKFESRSEEDLAASHTPEADDEFWFGFTQSGTPGRRYQRSVQRPLPLVTQLYELGAHEVWVDGTHMATQVVVELPVDRPARQAVIDRMVAAATADVGPRRRGAPGVGRKYFGVILSPYYGLEGAPREPTDGDAGVSAVQSLAAPPDAAAEEAR